jgi:hypothetical protein
MKNFIDFVSDVAKEPTLRDKFQAEYMKLVTKSASNLEQLFKNFGYDGISEAECDKIISNFKMELESPIHTLY